MNIKPVGVSQSQGQVFRGIINKYANMKVDNIHMYVLCVK